MSCRRVAGPVVGVAQLRPRKRARTRINDVAPVVEPDIVNAAIRGSGAGHLEKIATVHTTPGFSDEVIHIFLAKNLSKGRCAHEKDEIIETIEVSQKELMRMLDSGEITDAKTLVGIYAAMGKNCRLVD